jgi:hypothetical protein
MKRLISPFKGVQFLHVHDLTGWETLTLFKYNILIYKDTYRGLKMVLTLENRLSL